MISAGARPVMLRAVEGHASPARGFTRPLIAMFSVVLPAPLEPSTATISPAFTLERDAVQHARQAVAGDEVAAPQACATPEPCVAAPWPR